MQAVKVTFGISADDQIILQRLKNNRDASHTADTEEKIEPVIVYTTASANEEIKAKKKAYTKEANERRKAERKAMKIANNQKPTAKDTSSSCAGGTHKRSSPKAEIVMDGDTILLKWKRKISKNGRFDLLFHLPKELHDVFNEYVLLTYNPKSKKLVVEAV